MTGIEGSALKYDVDVDPTAETSHGKLARYTGRGKRVLDLGCATGSLARLLSSWGCTVVGVELDPEAAKLAERWCELVVVGDLDHLDLGLTFENRQFDVVVAGDVLEHLRDPGRVLDQIRELIAPGGHLALSVPNVAHGSVRLALLHGDFPYSDTGLLDRTHLQFLTRTTLIELLMDHGFAVAYLDETRLPVADSEVPFPDDALTGAVSGWLAVDADADVYQFVAIAVPGTEEALDVLPRLTRRLDEELRRSRVNASQWERRALSADQRVEELTAEAVEAARARDDEVEQRLVPLRQQLLVVRDQLAHRDHDVQRVVALYEQHTAALRHVEAERAAAATALREAQERGAEEAGALESELQEIHESRLWRYATGYRGLRARIEQRLGRP